MGRIEILEKALGCNRPDRELAQQVGLSAWHITALKHYCRDNQAMIILRAAKSAGRRFHNRSDYRPKPVDLKQKTQRGMAHGDSMVYPHINKFYSDYDIMSLWKRADTETGTAGAEYAYAVPSLVPDRSNGVPKPVRWQGDIAYNALNCPIGYRDAPGSTPKWYGWECQEGLDALDELNEYLGDSTMFQHGANDQYRNWRSQFMENEIEFQEKFIAIDRHMQLTLCRNARALKSFYDLHGLEWPPYEVRV